MPGRALVAWNEFKVYGGAIHAVEAFMSDSEVEDSAKKHDRPD
jgi:hypothetical protein